MNEKTSAAYVAASSLPIDGPCQPMLDNDVLNGLADDNAFAF